MGITNIVNYNIITFDGEYENVMDSICNALNVGKMKERYNFEIVSGLEENEIALRVDMKITIRSIPEVLKDVDCMESFATGFWLSFMEYGGEEF